ncbi:unnamed protein product [Prunus brigantina]
MLPDPREGPSFAQSTPLCDEPSGFERHQFESCQSPVIAQIEQPIVVVFPAASNTVPSSVQNEVDMVAAQSWSDEEDGFTPWWMGFSFYGCPMFVLSSKLRALKAKLNEWNWREFGDINAKVNDSMRALESIQTEIANLGPSDERFLRENQKMFTADAEVVNTGLVERVNPSLVTAGDNMLLTSIPSQEEIFGVVKSMDSLSSPGPDGFGGIFFLHCWSVVGHEVVQACRPVALANFVFKIITKILANHVFSRGISSLIESGAMRRINAPRGVMPPSHVLFADDIMVFIQGTTKNLRVLMRFMVEYGVNSGQFINKSKSLAFLGHYVRPRQASILRTLGIGVGSFPFTYLGVPIFQAKEAYLWLSSHNASVPWSKVSWDKAFQPRKRLVVWKALQSRLLTDEFLQKRGVSLAS